MFQRGFHQQDIYSECKSVIVFGVNLPKGLTKLKSSLIYGHFNNFSCSIFNKITSDGAKSLKKNSTAFHFLSKRGFDTVECNKFRKVCPMRYDKSL